MRSRTCLVFALLIALSIGLTTQPFAQSPLPTLPSVYAASRSISLIGNFNGWNNSLPSGKNPTITVNQGDSVTISLSSNDFTHQFALDIDKDGAMFTGACTSGDNCSQLFDISTTTSIVIKTGSLSGTYTYFCTFHSLMVGSFNVVAGAVGGTTVPTIGSLILVPYLVVTALLSILVSAVVAVRSSRRKEKRLRQR